MKVVHNAYPSDSEGAINHATNTYPPRFAKGGKKCGFIIVQSEALQEVDISCTSFYPGVRNALVGGYARWTALDYAK